MIKPEQNLYKELAMSTSYALTVGAISHMIFSMKLNRPSVRNVVTIGFGIIPAYCMFNFMKQRAKFQRGKEQ